MRYLTKKGQERAIEVFAPNGLAKMSDWKLAEAKFKYMSSRLSEAYARNDNIDWLEVFEKIKLRFKGELTGQVWSEYCLSTGIGFELVAGKNAIGGYFDLEYRVIVIQVTKDILDVILEAEEEDLKKLAKDFWTNFCHEDTHRQQATKSKVEINKTYKATSSQHWDIDLEEDLSYFDQCIEADAYGREIGAKLQILYPNEGTTGMFNLINRNKIKNRYCKRIINIYKDPRISDKANHSFFRALYDYLEGNEL